MTICVTLYRAFMTWPGSVECKFVCASGTTTAAALNPSGEHRGRTGGAGSQLLATTHFAAAAATRRASEVVTASETKTENPNLLTVHYPN